MIWTEVGVYWQGFVNRNNRLVPILIFHPNLHKWSIVIQKSHSYLLSKVFGNLVFILSNQNIETNKILKYFSLKLFLRINNDNKKELTCECKIMSPSTVNRWNRVTSKCMLGYKMRDRDFLWFGWGIHTLIMFVAAPNQ